MTLRRQRDGASAAYLAAGRPGRATPWRTARWCAIDLELTGLDPDNDHVIAVGAVPVQDGRVVLGDVLYTLVNSSRPSGEAAVVTHKLRVADLAGAPSLDEALEQLLDMLAGRVPVFHFAAIERAFLAPLLRRRRVRLPESADTEALGRLWLHRRDGVVPSALGLERLAELLHQRAETPHHALGDALSTAQAFIALASHLDRTGAQTVGSLTAAGALLGGERRSR